MGTKYSSQSATGFNASPPPDDGSTTASNKITWNSTILGKIGTPLSNFITAVNSALVNAFNYAFSLNTTTYTTVAADNCTVIENTGSNTVSLGDAATLGAGYMVGVKNTGTGLTTVALITAADTLDGTANGTIAIPPKQCVFFGVNQAVNGYDIIAGSNPYRQGADVASASTTVLDTYDGDYVHVTGTTTITAITLGKGAERTVEFTGILTLTNGASLILPGGANITTAAGDTAIFRGEASGVVRCISYVRAAGTLGTSQATSSGTAWDFTIPSWAKQVSLSLVGFSTNGTSIPIIQLGDAGGIETSGYLGSALTVVAGGGGGVNHNTGFALGSTWAATAVAHGTLTLTLVDPATFTWAISGVIGRSDLSTTSEIVGGSYSTSATTTTIRLTMVNGTDAGDAGKVNVRFA